MHNNKWIYHSLLSEIDADRRREPGVEDAIGVLEEKARFADTRIAQSEEFK